MRTKDLLKRKGLKFTEINLDGKDSERSALKARTGMQTMPQIFIDGQLIGGFQELAGKDSRGELEANAK